MTPPCAQPEEKKKNIHSMLSCFFSFGRDGERLERGVRVEEEEKVETGRG